MGATLLNNISAPGITYISRTSTTNHDKHLLKKSFTYNTSMTQDLLKWLKQLPTHTEGSPINLSGSVAALKSKNINLLNVLIELKTEGFKNPSIESINANLGKLCLS